MSESTPQGPVCVIGAGSSGLAAVQALAERRMAVECFEQGSDIGGNWRYRNDAGSAAYESLRTNVSRPRMQYPGFPMPKSYGDFVHHSDMAEYLDAYAAAFGLRDHIRVRTTVVRVVKSAESKTWRVTLGDGSERDYRAVVVANGHHWDAIDPAFPGQSSADAIHSRDYRTPERFGGKRVLVVGCNQSACEIAGEISGAAAHTYLSVPRGAHVIPRWIRGKPYDRLDLDVTSRLPWRLINWFLEAGVAASPGGRASDYGLPAPDHRLIEGLPAITSDLVPALRRGSITVKPKVERLEGEHVRFEDGSRERVDGIVYATGYRISFPFLDPELLEPRGKELPLYRRIVPPRHPGLCFVGLVDAPGGLLPIVETQATWIAALLGGRLSLPSPKRMWAAIEKGERRTRQRFPMEGPHSIRCDPHTYKRVLARDLRRVSVKPEPQSTASAPS